MRARNLLAGTPASMFVAAVLAAFAGGCGDETGGSGGGSSGPPADGVCFEDPLSCEDGTVCAFDDEDGKAMSCLPVGAGVAGDTCQNVAGKPECGKDLICLKLKGAETGACTPYCDGADDCKGGLECAQIKTDGERQFFACAKL